MEISAKVLREVEFSGSLRGYNTDEVDEFLEQVAIAVDSLQAEARAAAERAEKSERSREERSGLDDDESIRRTLVLAQRTAALAVKEAEEESARLLDRARAEAEALVSDARESAERLSSEAERRLRAEVARLSRVRDELKSDATTLVSLLAAERERLTESLGTALNYVEKSLTPSAEISAMTVASGDLDGEAEEDLDGLDEGDGLGADANGPAVDVEDEEAVPTAEADQAEGGDDAVDELEAAIAEDAAAAAPARFGGGSSYEPEGALSATMAYERPNLTALPSFDDSMHDTAAWPAPSPQHADWPA